MTIVIHFIMEMFPVAAICYACVWGIMRHHNGERLQLGGQWHLLGCALAAVSAGFVRIVSAFLFGGRVSVRMAPEGAGLLVWVLVPVVMSSIYCAGMRRWGVATPRRRAETAGATDGVERNRIETQQPPH